MTGDELLIDTLIKEQENEALEEEREKHRCFSYKLAKWEFGGIYRTGDFVGFEGTRWACLYGPWCSGENGDLPGDIFGSSQWIEIPPFESWDWTQDTFDSTASYSEGDLVVYKGINFKCVADYTDEFELTNMRPGSLHGILFWEIDHEAQEIESSLTCEEKKVMKDGAEFERKSSLAAKAGVAAADGDPDFNNGEDAVEPDVDITDVVIIDKGQFKIVNGQIDFTESDPDLEFLRKISTPIPGDLESFSDDNYLLFDNVERVNRVLSSQGYTHIFSGATGGLAVYNDFLKAVARFPAFCGGFTNNTILTDDQLCAKELATIFAHCAFETGKNDTKDATTPAWRQGLAKLIPDGCPDDETCPVEGNTEDSLFAGVDGVKYYGRGPLRIHGNRLVGQFSKAFLGDESLLTEPSPLETDGYISWGSALWMYMTMFSPNPSGHMLVAGLYELNEKDSRSGARYGFGLTTVIYKGKEECGRNSTSTNPAIRYEYYLKLVEYWSIPIDTSEMGTCGAISSLTNDRHYKNLFWDYQPAETEEDEDGCTPVNYPTPWSLLTLSGYDDCVAEGPEVYSLDTGVDKPGQTPDLHDPCPGKYTVDQATLALTVANAPMMKAIESARPIAGTPDIADENDLTSEPENVRRCANVFPKTKYDLLVPNKLKMYTYKAFLQNVKKYPKFCGEYGGDATGLTTTQLEDKLKEVCKRSIAALFSHLAEACGSKKDAAREDRYKWSLASAKKDDCLAKDNCEKYSHWGFLGFEPFDDVYYYPRGASCMSDSHMYGKFSHTYLGNKYILLQDPDQVATDGFLAFGTAFFSWMTPISPNPSPHDVMVGNYKPNAQATTDNLVGPYSVVSRILGGRRVCGHKEKTNHFDVNRASNFKNILKNVFDMSTLENEITSCAFAGEFNDSHQVSLPLFFEIDYEKNIPTCKCTSRPGEFAQIDADGWTNCLKFARGEEVSQVPASSDEDDFDFSLFTDALTDNTPTQDGPQYKIHGHEAELLDPELIRIAETSKMDFEHAYFDEYQPEENLPNVQRVMSICDIQCFNEVFAQRSNAFQYEHLMTAIAHYPRFCDDSQNDDDNRDALCKEELSALLAMMVQDSGLNDSSNSTSICEQGLFYFQRPCNETDCEQANYDSEFYVPSDGAQYYARGVGQVKGSENYARFSQAYFFDSSHLLWEPNLLDDDVYMSVLSALWKFMTPQHNKPSAHDIILKFWEPNQEDSAQKITSGFGSMVNVYTNGADCKGDTDGGANRATCFKYFLEKFQRPVPSEDERMCSYQNDFTSKGAGSKNYYWDVNPARPKECKLSSRMTAFPIWIDDAYAHCTDYYTSHAATTASTGLSFDGGSSEEDECLNNPVHHHLGSEVVPTENPYELPEENADIEVNQYKEGESSYKNGSIVEYYGLRYMCRDAKKCGKEVNEPGTPCGDNVWHLLTSSEALTKKFDNYSANKKHAEGDKVVSFGYEFECVYEEFCNDPEYHPLATESENVWLYLRTVPLDEQPADPNHVYVDPSTLKGPKSDDDLFDPASDTNDSDPDLAVPACLYYALEKFPKRKQYKLGQIVYYDGNRYVCVEEACHYDMDPSEYEESWHVLKSTEGLDLRQDTYKINRVQDSVILLGVKYNCVADDKEFCAYPWFNPLVDRDIVVWQKDDGFTLVSEGDCFDLATSTKPWDQSALFSSSCLSYIAPDYITGHEDYVVGDIVNMAGVYYWCKDSYGCKDKHYKPGGVDSDWVWEEVVDIFDLSQDTYVFGKPYAQGDKVVLHGMEFECNGYETYCSDPERSPLHSWNFELWEFVEKKESSIVCQGTAAYQNGKQYRKAYYKGVPRYTKPKEPVVGDTGLDYSFTVLTENEGTAQETKTPEWTDGRVEALVASMTFENVSSAPPSAIDAMTNVALIKTLLDENTYNTLFCQKNAIYTYANLVKAFAYFPAFCNQKAPHVEATLEEVCRKELVVALAHLSAFNADPNGVPPSTEDCIAGLTLTSFETCEVDAAGVNSCEHYTNVFDERYPPVAGQLYHPRGSVPISGNTEIGMFSEEVLGDKNILLNNPGLLETRGDYAIAIAIWWFMKNHGYVPSAHSVVVGMWEPNFVDTEQGLTPGFGTTLALHNNGWGCINNKTISKQIVRNFAAIAKTLQFQVNLAEQNSCKGIGYFEKNGGGDYKTNFAIDWNAPEPACKVVSHSTPFNIYDEDALKECIKSAADTIQELDNKTSEMMPVADRVMENADGSFSIFDPVLKKTVHSATYIRGDVKVDMEKPEQPNIKRIMRLFSEEDFDNMFADRRDDYNYEDMIHAAARFPTFCDEQGLLDKPDDDEKEEVLDDACKRELSTFLAHAVYETSEFEESADEDILGSAFSRTEEFECPENYRCWEHINWNLWFFLPDTTAATEHPFYHGRGVLGLRFNQNYAQCSKIVEHNKYYLLYEPDRVAHDPWLRWVSGLWYYMTPQIGMPSMHEVATLMWSPSKKNREDGVDVGFGTTINIMRGYEECGEFNDPSKANQRAAIYVKLLEDLGSDLLDGEKIDCEDSTPLNDPWAPQHQEEYTTQGATAAGTQRILQSDPNATTGNSNDDKLLLYFDAVITISGVKCQLVEYITDFSVFNKTSYSDCLKASKGEEYEKIPEELTNTDIDVEYNDDGSKSFVDELGNRISSFMDGTTRIERPDGIVETIEESGRRMVRRSDGAEFHYDEDNQLESIWKPNPSPMVQSSHDHESNTTKILVRGMQEKTVFVGEDYIHEQHANGSEWEVMPNNNIMVKFEKGDWLNFQNDKSVTFTDDNNNRVTISPDGNVSAVDGSNAAVEVNADDLYVRYEESEDDTVRYIVKEKDYDVECIIESDLNRVFIFSEDHRREIYPDNTITDKFFDTMEAITRPGGHYETFDYNHDPAIHESYERNGNYSIMGLPFDQWITSSSEGGTRTTQYGYTAEEKLNPNGVLTIEYFGFGTLEKTPDGRITFIEENGQKHEFEVSKEQLESEDLIPPDYVKGENGDLKIDVGHGYNITQGSDGDVVLTAKDFEVKKKADGEVEFKLENEPNPIVVKNDGTIRYEDEKGNAYNISPDGTVAPETSPNRRLLESAPELPVSSSLDGDDQFIHLPNEMEVRRDTTDSKIKIEKNDGTEIEVEKDNTIKIESKDIKIKAQRDGSVEMEGFGKTLEAKKDGGYVKKKGDVVQETSTVVNGTRTVQSADGETRVSHADGKEEIKDSNGDSQTTYNDGSIFTFDKEGNLVSFDLHNRKGKDLFNIIDEVRIKQDADKNTYYKFEPAEKNPRVIIKESGAKVIEHPNGNKASYLDNMIKYEFMNAEEQTETAEFHDDGSVNFIRANGDNIRISGDTVVGTDRDTNPLTGTSLVVPFFVESNADGTEVTVFYGTEVSFTTVIASKAQIERSGEFEIHKKGGDLTVLVEDEKHMFNEKGEYTRETKGYMIECKVNGSCVLKTASGHSFAKEIATTGDVTYRYPDNTLTEMKPTGDAKTTYDNDYVLHAYTTGGWALEFDGQIVMSERGEDTVTIMPVDMLHIHLHGKAAGRNDDDLFWVQLSEWEYLEYLIDGSMHYTRRNPETGEEEIEITLSTDKNFEVFLHEYMQKYIIRMNGTVSEIFNVGQTTEYTVDRADDGTITGRDAIGNAIDDASMLFQTVSLEDVPNELLVFLSTQMGFHMKQDELWIYEQDKDIKIDAKFVITVYERNEWTHTIDPFGTYTIEAGEERLVYNDDGSVVFYDREGKETKKHIGENGEMIITYPDKSVETRYDNGKADFKTPDGTTIEYFPDGTTKIKDKDGKTNTVTSNNTGSSGPEFTQPEYKDNTDGSKDVMIDKHTTVNRDDTGKLTFKRKGVEVSQTAEGDMKVKIDGMSVVVDKEGNVDFTNKEGKKFEISPKGSVKEVQQTAGRILETAADKAKPEIDPESLPVQSTELADGSFETKLPQNNVIITNKEGSTLIDQTDGFEVRPTADGGMKMKNSNGHSYEMDKDAKIKIEDNGNTMETDSDGTVRTTDDKGNTKETKHNADGKTTTFSDGRKIEEKDNGETKTTYPDGESEVITADGSVFIFNADQEIVHYEPPHEGAASGLEMDGVSTEVKDNGDGTKDIKWDIGSGNESPEMKCDAAGNKNVQHEGYKTDYKNDKSIEVVKESTAGDETIKIKPDGELEVTKPNGDVLTVMPDGTTTGVDSGNTPLTGDALKTPYSNEKGEDGKVTTYLGEDHTIVTDIDGKKTEYGPEYFVEFDGKNLEVRPTDNEDVLMFDGDCEYSLERDGKKLKFGADKGSTITDEKGNQIDIKRDEDNKNFGITYPDGTSVTVNDNGGRKHKYSNDLEAEIFTDGSIIIRDSKGDIVYTKKSSTHQQGRYSIYDEKTKVSVNNNKITVDFSREHKLEMDYNFNIMYEDKEIGLKSEVDADRNYSIDFEGVSYLVSKTQIMQVMGKDTAAEMTITLPLNGDPSGQDAAANDLDMTTVYFDFSIHRDDDMNAVIAFIPGLMTIEYHDDGKVVEHSFTGSNTIMPDNSITINRTDGEEITVDLSGTIVKKMGEESITIDGSGMVTHVNQDGHTTIKSVDTTGKETITFSDGRIETITPGGKIEETRPDGSTYVECQDGSFMNYKEDGSLDQYHFTEIDDSMPRFDNRIVLEAGAFKEIQFRDHGEDNGKFKIDGTVRKFISDDEEIHWDESDNKLTMKFDDVTFEIGSDGTVEQKNSDNSIYTIPPDGANVTGVDGTGSPLDAASIDKLMVFNVQEGTDVHTEFEGRRIVTSSDGNRVQYDYDNMVHYDASNWRITSESNYGDWKIEIFPDGSFMETRGDEDHQILIEHSTSGNIIMTNWEGRHINATPDASGNLTITMSDGTTFTTGSDGTRVKTLCDGSKIEKYPGGAVSYIDKNGKNLKTEIPDNSGEEENFLAEIWVDHKTGGDIVVYLWDEMSLEILANKDKKWKDEEEKKVGYVFSNGEIRMTSPNKEDLNATDTVTINPDGSATVITPKGTVNIDADGTVNGTLATTITNRLNTKNNTETRAIGRTFETLPNNEKKEHSSVMEKHFKSDGSVVLMMGEGIVVEIQEDGSVHASNPEINFTLEIDASGSIVKTDETGGTVSETKNADGSVTTTFPGGMTMTLHPNGMQEFTYGDGTKNTICSDQSNVHLEGDDSFIGHHVMENEWEFLHGAEVVREAAVMKEILLPDGSQVVFMQDHMAFYGIFGMFKWMDNGDIEMEVTHEDMRIVWMANGEIKQLNNDGTTITVSADFTTISGTDKDNNVLTDLMPKFEFTEKDGKKMIWAFDAEISKDADMSITFKAFGMAWKLNRDRTLERKVDFDKSQVLMLDANGEVLFKNESRMTKFKASGEVEITLKDGKVVTIESINGGKQIERPDGTIAQMMDDGSYKKTLCNDYVYERFENGDWEFKDPSGIVVNSEYGGTDEKSEEQKEMSGLFLEYIQMMNNTIPINYQIMGVGMMIKHSNSFTVMFDDEKRTYFGFNIGDPMELKYMNPASTDFERIRLKADGTYSLINGAVTVEYDTSGLDPQGNVGPLAFNRIDADSVEFTDHYGLTIIARTDTTFSIMKDGATFNFAVDLSLNIEFDGRPTIDINADNSVMVVDGPETLSITPNGVSTFTDQDGNQDTLETAPDGVITKNFHDGREEIIADGFEKHVDSDGNTEVFYPYHSEVKMNANGDVCHFVMGEHDFKDLNHRINVDGDSTFIEIDHFDRVEYNTSGTITIHGNDTTPAIEFEKSTATVLLEHQGGIITIDEDANLTDRQTSGTIVSISAAGVKSAVDSNGNQVNGTFFTPAFFEGVDTTGQVVFKLPGGIMAYFESGKRTFYMQDGTMKVMENNGNYTHFFANSNDRTMIDDSGSTPVMKEFRKDREIIFEQNGNVTIKDMGEPIDITSTIAAGVRTIVDRNGATIVMEQMKLKYTFGDNSSMEQVDNTTGDHPTLTYTKIDGNTVTLDQARQNCVPANAGGNPPGQS